jgi:hypothetical protein
MRLFSVVFLLFVLLPSLSFADCSNHVESIQSIGDMKAAFRCLNDEIKRLEQKLKQGGAGTVVVNPIPNLPTPTISETITYQEIKYDLLGCSNKNGKVECNLQMTLLDGEKTITLKDSTRIFDENGEKHDVNYIQLGNASSDYRNKNITLISNFPVKLILRFSGIPTQSTRIVVLKIFLYHRYRYNERYIQFRNIALQR